MSAPVADAERHRTAAPATRPAGATVDTPAAIAAAPPQPQNPTSIGHLGVQAKAVVGAVADPAEREADAMADRVMRAPAPATVVEPAPGTPAADVKPEDLRRQAVPVVEPPRPEAETSDGGDTDGDTGDTDPAASTTGGEVASTLQDYLERTAGQGLVLPPSARGYFEARFGRNLGDVRIHDDPQADTAARSLGAQAFTRGHGIYFAAGRYDPESESGRRLLAHELAHVVQQGGTVRRKVTTPPPPPTTPAAPPGPKFTDPTLGTIDTDKPKEAKIAELEVPKFKREVMETLGHPRTLRRSEEKRDTNQVAEWEKPVRSQVEQQVRDHIAAETKKTPAPGPPYFLTFTHAKWGTMYYIGTAEQIASRVVRPAWDKAGKSAQFDVDHKHEYQLGGHDLTPKDNLWLLDSSANRSAGSRINTAITTKRDALIAAARPQLKPKPNVDTILRNYTFTVDKLVDAKDAVAGDPGTFWTAAEIVGPEVAKPLKLLPEKEAKKLRGTSTTLRIFSNPHGGSMRAVPYDENPTKVSGWEKKGLFQIREVRWFPPAAGVKPGEKVGSVTGRAFQDGKLVTELPITVPILGMNDVDFGGYLSAYEIRSAMTARGLSPIRFPTLDFDVVHGLTGRGVILPDLPLLKNRAEIALVLDERGVGVAATLTAGNLNLPGPFRVTGGALELYGGTGGLEVRGDVYFEIEKLAKGRVGAAAGTATGFSLTGDLEFDTSMFTKAKLGLSYREGRWGVKGELGIGPGKVAGIRSAAVAVTVADDTVEAKGEFESSLKGLERGTLGFRYDPTTGVSIEGALAISKLPGIKGGQITARVAERADGQGWSLAGQVSAEPSVPGVTGSITGRYADGAFLVDADLGYKRALLDGRVHLGLTNQAVGPDGKPAGPPTDALLVYGGGRATLRLAPWLIATAGLEYKPNGEVVITGRIGLPQALELFPEKRYDRTLSSLGLDIPIIGVAVAGQRIGIFATVRGGLDASAGIGPGQLRELGLEVTYNPDREDETRVAGRALFVIPASAGLRLFVRGGVGAGIPVVSATAGLEVSGALGLAGAASAGVDVLWTPARGLILDAQGSIFVEPRFRFAVDAFVDVSADLWATTIELFKKKWSLTAFEYGSGLRFGVLFPVHYEEGKPFDVSPEALQFVYPTIDTGELLRGLIGNVVGG